MPRTLLALPLVLLLAAGAAAQTEPVMTANPAEFGRASGGAIDAITKTPRQTSGSLSLMQSSGALRGRGYEATLGGELVNDRLWFFGAASVLPATRVSGAGINAVDAKATAHPVDWTSVTATFHRLQQPSLATTPEQFGGVQPSSFLSLRSTSVLSDRMIFDFSFSRQSGTRPAFAY